MNDEGKEIIRCRVDPDLKKAFEEASTRNDQTASQVLRQLMRDYVRHHAQGDLLKPKKR
jgi:hypothetical protein